MKEAWTIEMDGWADWADWADVSVIFQLILFHKGFSGIRVQSVHPSTGFNVEKQRAPQYRTPSSD
jgi:hypothetical protein